MPSPANIPCTQLDPELFFPLNSELEPAPLGLKAICATCPLQIQCRNWALERGEYGIWGGLSDFERKKLRRKVHRATCPGCQSRQINAQAGGEICVACGLSWIVQRHHTSSQSLAAVG